ncbi:hypothetical protein BD769DRAFT_1388701 [Suillus cothurnatus]|nr:hypothetical protein BD769DRAFT_1388701 [Suillus cothurnatus]
MSAFKSLISICIAGYWLFKKDTDDIFLRHMDVLGPQSFRLVVHYKEAIHERERMSLFTAYWALEESTRLHALCQFLYRAAEDNFNRAEQEAALMLRALLEKYPLSTGVADDQSLSAVCDHNWKSLRGTNAQLDLLKDHIEQEWMTRLPTQSDLDNQSDAA